MSQKRPSWRDECGTASSTTTTTTMSKASQPELKKVSQSLHLAHTPFILIPLRHLVYGQKIVHQLTRWSQGQRDIARLRPFPQSSHRRCPRGDHPGTKTPNRHRR